MFRRSLTAVLCMSVAFLCRALPTQAYSITDTFTCVGHEACAEQWYSLPHEYGTVSFEFINDTRMTWTSFSFQMELFGLDDSVGNYSGPGTATFNLFPNAGSANLWLRNLNVPDGGSLEGSFDYTGTSSEPALYVYHVWPDARAVPEPGTVALLLPGMFGIVFPVVIRRFRPNVGVLQRPRRLSCENRISHPCLPTSSNPSQERKPRRKDDLEDYPPEEGRFL